VLQIRSFDPDFNTGISMTEKKFKSYEEMTAEERNERNREAFTWKDGDLVFYPPKQPPKKKRGLYHCVTGPLLDEAFESNSLLTRSITDA
jgi:hypothetical protein